MPTKQERSPLPLTPALAAAADAADIFYPRNRLVEWMAGRGISQWHHDDVSEEQIRRQAKARQWWLIRADTGRLVAAIRALDEDPRIWGQPDRGAIYVHGLMVDRCYAGQGLGRMLLAWTAEQGRQQDAEVLRLDCVATNLVEVEDDGVW